MEQAVCYLRLEPAAFPTAENLNLGTGPVAALQQRKLRQRELRRAAHAEFRAARLARAAALALEHPRTGAYVVLADSYVTDKTLYYWIRNPRRLEEKFRQAVSYDVPADYLDRFERFILIMGRWIAETVSLQTAARISGKGPGLNESQFGCYSDVLHMLVMVTPGNRSTIVLRQVCTRPCAEGCGFFRLALFALTSMCIRLNCWFVVENAVQHTQLILTRAFPHAVRVLEADADDTDITLMPSQLTPPGGAEDPSAALMRALGVEHLIRSVEPYPVDWSLLPNRLPVLPPPADVVWDMEYSDDSYDEEWVDHLRRTGTTHAPRPSAQQRQHAKRTREGAQQLARDASSDDDGDGDGDGDGDEAAEAGASLRPKLRLRDRE